MSFLYPKTGKKARRTSGAYLGYTATRTAARGLEAELAVIYYSDWPPDHLPKPTTDMGRKTQKSQPGPSKESHNIGEMLQRPNSKMATRPEAGEHRSDSQTGTTTPGDSPIMSPAMTPLEAMADQDPQAPATKQDIANLLRELRHMTAANLDAVCTKVQAVSARTQTMETEVQDLKREVHNLLHSHTYLTLRVDLAEDCKRCANIKLRRVSDTIDQAELPQYLRWLMDSLLPHSQAKKIQLEGCYRINKSQQAPSDASRDIIVRYQSVADRNRILAAVKGKPSPDPEVPLSNATNRRVS
ncbi:Hypothetical predicted protein [Pelobates cultripes]|uniref:Uncharacterized protein n=1 Tax=Pelobates cultripes TaxID=61616 RepID=A0AAD1RRD8_PELCU|nr:Hypothetical predicted protein [Pelobates cultripes]